MRVVEWSTLTPAEREQVLARPKKRRDARIAETVRAIFEDVERDGEVAVDRWCQRLDRRPLECKVLDGASVDAARAQLDTADLEAIDFAIEQVRFYHEATAPAPVTVETTPGVVCRRVWRPIQTCGLYTPAGTAPLVSTLIMLAVPAGVARVPNRVLVSPPSNSGTTHPAIVVAAAACGLDAIWCVGGAQAIAALTYGAGLPKADKVFGPGNAYVAEAKRFASALQGGPAMDLPAGPSELAVVADGSANAAFVAADLLSQAEHDADAQVLLISSSAELIADVGTELARQIETLPRRDTALMALEQARFIKARDLEEAVAIANLYAPEHLSLAVNDPIALLALISSAGAVFVGRNGAESYGDYLVGPSHVLPTDGAAKAWAGITTASFMRSFTVQEVDGEAV
ncbi:MAG: histidinol dehydrogenase, partial [Proteobacteria bacterium]|nr:histidinol dehydrogenase [Pseudomonadota bacterium]